MKERRGTGRAQHDTIRDGWSPVSDSESREEGEERGRRTGPKSLFYLERTRYLHHSSSPRIMSKPDDSKRKQGVDENEA